MEDDSAEGDTAVRKKNFKKSEILDRLKKHDNKVKEVASECALELCDFDITDEEAMQVEDRVNRLSETIGKLAQKVYKIKNEFKDKQKMNSNTRKRKMEEVGISSSQYSIFDSEPMSDIENALSDVESSQPVSQPASQPSKRPETYKKKPLTEEMAQRSRRRRVVEKRVIFEKWAEEEGLTVTKLLGYFMHLDNYHSGEKSLAAIGYRVFAGEKVFNKSEVSLDEAIWMIELGGINQAAWLEFRLRLQDRIGPPVNKVREENQKYRPELTIYKHGVMASLDTCLSLTLTDRLKHIDLTGISAEGREITFKFTWGLDRSGDHSNYHQLSKVGFSTKQVMSVCFALREVTVRDSKGAKASWSSSTAGANKPQNTRPLALFPAKENQELLEDFVPKVEAQIKKVKAEGVAMKIGGEELRASCVEADLAMADGKMVTSPCTGVSTLAILDASL